MDEITRDIKELQTYLRNIASNDSRIRAVGIDGIYGEETRQAVRDFQSAYGLDVTGVVSPSDFEAIVTVHNEFLRKNAPHRAIQVVHDPDVIIKFGDSNDAVYFLQIMLSALSQIYKNIPTPNITGIYDEQTERAALSFKRISDSINIDKAAWNSIVDNYNRL